MNILQIAVAAIISLSHPTAVRDSTIHFHSLAGLPKSRKIMARLTTYSRDERHCDRNTRRGLSATGTHLVNRQTAAVDPKVIPYGSRIVIPKLGMTLTAADTGGAVKKRTASKKTGRSELVIDVFFTKSKDAQYFVANNPKIVEVYIIQ